MTTVIHQGKFTSNGRRKVIRVRSDIDWFRVINWTVASANQTAANGVEYLWLRDFPSDGGLQYKKSNAANASNLTGRINSGFNLFDSSDRRILGDSLTVHSISDAEIPILTHEGLNPPGNPPISPGDYVMLYDVNGARHFSNIIFSVGFSTLTSTTFSLDYAPKLDAQATGGHWRRIQFTPLYDPHQQTITKISNAQQAVVTFADTHDFEATGQKVRFNIPPIYKMTGLDGVETEIVAVDQANNTVTVNFDTRSFRAFVFPGESEYPFSQAQMFVYGRPSNEASANKLDTANDNDAFIGIELQASTNSPAGSDGDVIYWSAGKSYSIKREENPF